jgi:hypothetical protein
LTPILDRLGIGASVVHHPTKPTGVGAKEQKDLTAFEQKRDRAQALAAGMGDSGLVENLGAAVTSKMPIKQTLTRAERNRRAMNGVPMSNPPPLIRRHDQRSPMINLEAADEAAELEIARKAQIEAKEKSRLEHQAVEASAPVPGKAKKPHTPRPRGRQRVY